MPESALAAVGELLPPDRARAIARALLDWFRQVRRDLPWRRTDDPYAIWVSEVMLQQTQVATVIPYFEAWMARFPGVEALARADESEVLRLWEGLGYYRRARNLLRGAREIVARYGGRVPDSVAELLSLPGIGRYTAGAIASIAYNRPAPVVDGNATRVLTRLFALRGDPSRPPLRRRLWALAEALLPEGRAREFNPALMELGATVCLPARPRCDRCPLVSFCAAHDLGLQDALPDTPRATPVTAVQMAAAVVRRDGSVLLTRRREDESRWPGLWQFPNAEVRPPESGPDAACRAVREAVGLAVRPGARVAVVRHAITRYRITLEAFDCEPGAGRPRAGNCREWTWAGPEAIRALALPAPHRRLATALFSSGDGRTGSG